MAYRVEFDRRAAKELNALPPQLRARILRAVARLANDPRHAPNTKPLQGGGYRLRVGNYRVIYVVRDDIVLVLILKIGHRREVYRR